MKSFLYGDKVRLSRAYPGSLRKKVGTVVDKVRYFEGWGFVPSYFVKWNGVKGNQEYHPDELNRVR